MSSTTESVKHPSDVDAPDPKKAKIDDGTTLKAGENNAENNNGTTANPDSKDLKKDVEGSSSGDVKTSNGNDKEPEHDEEDQVDEDIGEDLDSGSEPSDQMDPNVTRRLQQVQGIQQRISKLNELASEEILKVEQKFNKLRRPHFEQRNELLKDIPNFWVTCLVNHPTTTQLIESAEDEDCLHYMVNLDVEELEDIKSGYNLKFHFKENPYIKNSVIVKELRHLNSDEVVSKSTPIDWKDSPQARNLKSIVDSFLRQVAPSDRVDHVSFFSWMVLPCETGSDEIAEIIKDQIWPCPLEFFFHNQADDYDDNSDDDDDDSDEEYDEEDFGNEGAGEMPEEDIEGEELEDDDDDDDGDDDEDDGPHDIDEEDEE